LPCRPPADKTLGLSLSGSSTLWCPKHERRTRVKRESGCSLQTPPGSESTSISFIYFGANGVPAVPQALGQVTLFLPWHSSLCVLDDVTKWAENGTLAKTVAAAVTVTDEMLLGRLRYSRSGLRVRQSCERNPVYARPTTRLCRRHVTSLN
jgi:hypothetical protein